MSNLVVGDPEDRFSHNLPDSVNMAKQTGFCLTWSETKKVFFAMRFNLPTQLFLRWGGAVAEVNTALFFA